MKYGTTPEFDRDLKKLLKRFRTLESDLEILKQASLEIFHSTSCGRPDPVEIKGFGGGPNKAYKVRKIACKSLKGRGVMSGLRITYVYIPADDKIIFAEIYFKADQENENRKRLESITDSLK